MNTKTRLVRSLRFHFCAAKYAAQIVVLIGLMLAASAPAQTSKETPGIKPIESLWALPLRHFPGTSESDAAVTKMLKEWMPTGIFDDFLLLDLPPTFVDNKGFSKAANALIREVGGRCIIVTLPVGKEGWESSANQRFGEKNASPGTHFDASKAMSQADWFETLKDLDSDTWLWVLEQPARMPTPEEAARSAIEFIRFAKAQHKKTAINLSVQALTHSRAMEEMTKAICEAVRGDVDYIVWMDLPGETLQAGEDKWRETMDQLLDKILKLSPKEKTVMQWLNSPKWPTKDVEGTKTYISICQAKGINRFQVLCPPQGMLDREPWHDFYRTLPKTGAKQ